jgi:nitrogen-specific signal transduction histidine kinase
VTSSLLITAAVSSFLLGLLVLVRNPERITHRVFALLTFNLTLWSIGVFFIVHSHTPDTARNWIMITFVVAGFLPATFYHFIGYFPDQKFKGLQWYLYLLYGGAFVLGMLVNTTWYIVNIDVSPSEPPHAVYGPVFDVYTVMIVLTMALMFVNLFQKLRHSEGIQRRQLEHVLASIFAGVGLASATNVIAPFFSIHTMELYGPCFMVLMMAGLAYSMVRYHLLDIWFILSRTTVYAFITVFIFILYFSVVTLVHVAFSQAGRAYDILSIALTSLMVAVVIQPLRERAQLLLDRVIRHRRYDTESLSQRITRLANQFVQLDPIMERVSTDLRQTLGVTGLRVLLVDKGNEPPVRIAYSTRTVNPTPDDSVAYILEFVANHHEPLLLEELEHRSPMPQTARLARCLRALGAQVLIPLVTQSGVLGVIILESKETRDVYTYDDWRVFSTIAGPLATAIENSRLYGQLEELNVHLELILRNMRGTVIAVDTNGVIKTINQEGRSVLGPINPGMSLGLLDAKVAHLLQMTLDNKRGIVDVETTIVNGVGEEMPVAMSTSCLEMPGQGIKGAMVLIHNMTQIKRLESNVQRADRLNSIGTMAAGMAHEIKNPLQSIKTFTQLLLDRYDDADFRNTFAEVVPPEVDRIDSIVTRLLHFARPQPVSFRLHDIRQILTNVFALVENQMRKSGVDLRMDMPEHSVGVMADNQQLHQVFLNLVLNAIESMTESPNPMIEVKVSTGHGRLQQKGSVLRHDVPCVRTVIRDRGCGISRDHLKQLFTPFFTTKSDGSGLGLSVVHGIITEHQGVIDVSSTPGAGSSFTVTFPLAGSTESIERVGL